VQRLNNYIDDNAQIAHLEEGLEVDTTAAKAHFCELVSVANSWQNIPAGLEKNSVAEKKHIFLNFKNIYYHKVAFKKL
jgi:hypothetical protein